MMTTTTRSMLFVAVYLAVVAQAENVNVAVILPPSSSSFALEKAFIHGPGFVDLSNLRFEPSSVGKPTTIDVAVLRLDNNDCDGKVECAGIGQGMSDGLTRFCSAAGRLIYNETTFQGEARSLWLPRDDHIVDRGKINLYSSGLYAIVLANCDEDNGLFVAIQGSVTWKSVHGYLPGEMFGIMDYFILLLCGYIALLLAYGGSMYVHRGHVAPAEEWIMTTIATGLVAMVFEMAMWTALNRTGDHSFWLYTAAVFFGRFKQQAARVVSVLLAMGAGSNKLSNPRMRNVIRLGGVYLILGMTMDASFAFVVKTFKTHSMENEQVVLNFCAVIFVLLIFIDCIFCTWMVTAVNTTISYLGTLNRPDALQRYLQLRNIIRFILVATLLISALHCVHRSSLYGERYQWLLRVLTETVYVTCFAGVAYLWRPRADAKDVYAPLDQFVQEEECDLYLELTDSGSPPRGGASHGSYNYAPIS
jgi:hypothetical protein